jgi:hypothetical protein
VQPTFAVNMQDLELVELAETRPTTAKASDSINLRLIATRPRRHGCAAACAQLLLIGLALATYFAIGAIEHEGLIAVRNGTEAVRYRTMTEGEFHTFITMATGPLVFLPGFALHVWYTFICKIQYILYISRRTETRRTLKCSVRVTSRSKNGRKIVTLLCVRLPAGSAQGEGPRNSYLQKGNENESFLTRAM